MVSRGRALAARCRRGSHPDAHPHQPTPTHPPQNQKPTPKKQEFGKTKLYIPPQDGLDVLPKEQIDALKRQAAESRSAAAASAQRARQLEAELRGLEARLTPEQLDARIRELEAQVAELEARAAPLRAGGTALVTPAQKAAAEASLSRCLAEWRRRRGVFRAVWDAVSEGIEGKQSDLFEEIGVETDEAAGVSVQEVGSLLGKGGGGGGAGGRGLGTGGKAPPQMAAAAAGGGGGGSAAAAKKARAG